ITCYKLFPIPRSIFRPRRIFSESWRAGFAEALTDDATKRFPHTRRFWRRGRSANRMRSALSGSDALVTRGRLFQMNEPAEPITIALRIPGKWSQPRELIER